MVKVGVGYDTDVEQVRDILIDCAREHPQVLQTPPPRVFLIGFGDSALDFELRCIVANVENMLMVKSDLHFAVLARFRAAGIDIPFPQREVRTGGAARRRKAPKKQRAGRRDRGVYTFPRRGRHNSAELDSDTPLAVHSQHVVCGRGSCGDFCRCPVI